ncbi:MAG: aminopeptidase P family protein [Oscillospiraceae bacterium]|nr:aminopeptidase P family protein [Oscillospiraceae bacterium]
MDSTDRIKRLQQQIPDHLDCVIIKNRVNRFYFTRFLSSAGVFVVTRERAILLTDFRYHEKAVKTAKGCEVLLLKDDTMGQLMTSLAVITAGVEEDHVTLSEFADMKIKYGNIIFSEQAGISGIISDMRSVKSGAEIDRIKAAQSITDAAFEHMLEYLRTGLTELEVALEIERFIRKSGGLPAFDIIAVSGENSSLPHGTPGERVIQKGDLLTIDFGACLDGYNSDMTRTVAFGEIDGQKRRLYDTVLAAQELAVESVREGVLAKDADKTARDYIENSGYKDCFGHGLGHGIGLEVHENPFLSQKHKNALKEGMVVTIEPGIYMAGKYGVRIEDMVVVGKNGAENLTKSTKELIILN